jgi:hypothetical protein
MRDPVDAGTQGPLGQSFRLGRWSFQSRSIIQIHISRSMDQSGQGKNCRHRGGDGRIDLRITALANVVEGDAGTR